MKIYTYSILYNTFEEYAGKVPYVVAIVEDEDGKRQAAFIENYTPDQKVEIGMEVETVGHSETGNLICAFK